MVRYLKSTKDGWIFEWDEILAKRSDLIEISEKEVFPERFIPEKQVEVVENAKKTRKTRTFKFVEETQDGFPAVEPEPELDFGMPELAQEASRGWPK